MCMVLLGYGWFGARMKVVNQLFEWIRPEIIRRIARIATAVAFRPSGILARKQGFVDHRGFVPARKQGFVDHRGLIPARKQGFVDHRGFIPARKRGFVDHRGLIPARKQGFVDHRRVVFAIDPIFGLFVSRV